MSRTFRTDKRKSLNRIQAGAGESGTRDFGSTKSFKFEICDKNREKCRDYDKILTFFEDMNDIRFNIAERIKKKVESDEKKGIELEQSLRSLFKDDKDKKAKTIGYAKLIRLQVKEYLESNSEKYSKYNEGLLPYWVSYDFEGKLKSYVELYNMSGSSKKKRVFMEQVGGNEEAWQNLSKEQLNQELDIGIIDNITGLKNRGKYSFRKFQKWILKKSKADLKGKFKKFDFDENGKITKMIGADGVKEHNVLVNYIRIFIGQYKGQKTNKSIEQFVEENNLSKNIKTSRGVYKWIREQDKKKQEKLEKRFKEVRGGAIPQISPIKGYPSFPSFYRAQDYKDRNTGVIDIDEYKNQFENLKNSIEKAHYCEENTIRRELKINDENGLNVEHLKEEYSELCELQRDKTNRSLNVEGEVDSKDENDEDKENRVKSTGSFHFSNKKRFYRKAIYFYPDIEKAVNSELEFIYKRVLKVSSDLGNKKRRFSIKKLRLLSQLMGRYLRLLLNTRKTTSKGSMQHSLSDFERSQFGEEVKIITGNLQMEGLKIKPFQRFSFQFRQFDQEGLYPCLVSVGENSKLKLYLRAFKVSQEQITQGKETIRYLCFKSPTMGSSKCVLEDKKIYKGELLELPVVFSKRVGRKFIFNYLTGVREKQTRAKLGCPNFMVTYRKSNDTPLVGGSMANTRTEFKPNILVYKKSHSSLFKRSKFLLEQTRYFIGLDRGENKLFCYSVWDSVDKKIVDSGSIGDGFKSSVDSLKKEEADAQRSFKVNEYKRIRRKINNIIKSAVDEAINNLIKLSFQYRDKEKATALVLEALPSKLGRTGSKAYVELRQMNSLIVKIKETRNYYNMPFQIYEIGASYTSQACSECGNIDKQSRTEERFQCTKCGHKDDADVQASYNIIHKWIARKNYESQRGQDNRSEKERFSQHLANIKNQ